MTQFTMTTPLRLLALALVLTACGEEPKADPMTTTPAGTESPMVDDLPNDLPKNGAEAETAPVTDQPEAPIDDTPATGPITDEAQLLKEVGYVLRDVKSLEDAASAKVRLFAIGERAQPLIDEHKKAFTGSPQDLLAFANQNKAKLIEGLPLLQAELDRIDGIEGAREALQGPMTKIMGILNPQF